MKGYITESELTNIIAESIKATILAEYHLSDIDELMEYMWLKPKDTGLNVDIFVDDGGSYKLHGHQPLLLVRNGYDKSVTDFIPFSLEKKPKILDMHIDYSISYRDIFDVQSFIVNNLRNLLNLANRKIGQIEFANTIKKNRLNENKTLIMEMATLRKEDSGLPMDIWVDEGMTYVRHAPRIKFRASSEQRTTREFSSMLLVNPPVIENFPSNSPLKTKDINILKQFVIDNLDALKAVANGTCDFKTEFLPNIIKPNGK